MASPDTSPPRRDGGPAVATGDAKPSRRGRHIVAVLALLVLAVLALGVWRVVSAPAGGAGLTSRALSLYLALRQADLAAPGGDPAPVPFEVASGEGLASVAQRLAAAGVIKNADAFRLLARVQGQDRGVEAGRHELRRAMSAQEVLTDLQHGVGSAVRVTIPEGKRAEEVATILADAGLVDRGEFLTLVGQGAGGGPATADRPPGTGLEGYLFPDTYEFPPHAGAEAVLARLLETFEARVTPDMAAQAHAAKRSIYEIVTLASIIERETAAANERPKVARVYLNRLATAPYLLDADPTVQYGLGYQDDVKSWWKRPLTADDLKSDSAYNSYINPGLPPGPIASPGLASIQAALAPADGPWQYFVANGLACDGTHVFAATYDEHLANVAKYQTGGCRP